MQSPPFPPDTPRVAEGRYALVTRLGEGGMAVVYGAWDEDLRLWRAIKVLLPKYARRRSVRKRFEREARTMMALRHPNLVRVLDVNADRALPYLVMDLVPGGSLEDWTSRHGPMPPRLALEAATHIARGLAAVHAKGIVHRDVKPQNVLIDHDGTCKLTDFGVAQVEGGDTRTGVSMGTVGYMAPEQFADSKSVDARSDLYSVGATLYVLVTGAPVRDLFRIADEPRRLDVLPEALRPLLQRTLAYDREDRLPDAVALLDAIAVAKAAFPPVGPDVPPLPRKSSSGAVPGGSPGGFTELSGLLERSLPPPRDRAVKPVPAVVTVQATDIGDATELTDEEDDSAEATEDAKTEAVPAALLAPPPAPVPAYAPALRESVHRGPAPVPVHREPVHREPVHREPVHAGPSAALSAALSAETRAGPAIASAAMGTVATAIALGAVLVVLLVVGVPLLAAAGSAEVSSAAEQTAAATRIVEQRVRDGDKLVADLERLGVDTVGVRTAADGSPATFARALAAAARPVVSTRNADPDIELARQRLERVVWAVDHLDAAQTEWIAASERPLGRIAILAGLTTSPPP